MTSEILFTGDNFELLKNVQVNCFFGLVSKLYVEAKSRYISAINLIGVETDLYINIKNKDKFDYRVLKRVYDKIAAYYRFKHPTNGQLSIKSKMEDLSFESELEIEWRSFYTNEVEDITNNDLITKAILTAVGYENTEEGFEAEETILKFLDHKYPREFIKDFKKVGGKL